MDHYTKQLIAGLLLELHHRKTRPADAVPLGIFPNRANGGAGSAEHTDAKIREIIFGDSMTPNSTLLEIVQSR
jgi:hypothetical protein